MIYPLLLEAEFEKLPAVLRNFHSAPGERHASGILTVHHRNALLAWLVRFPPQGERIPIRLHVAATEHEEIWTRWFGNAIRRSSQRIAGNLLMETAGPVCVGFQVRVCENGMRFESRAARLWGIPLPLRIAGSATGGDSCWEVEVAISHIGSYRGVMRLDP